MGKNGQNGHNGNGYNGNGQDHGAPGGRGADPASGDSARDDAAPNIIRFPAAANRDRRRRPATGTATGTQAGAGRVPMINLPPVTKAVIATFIAVHVLLQLLAPGLLGPAYENFSFIPGRYTGALPFTAWALAAPVSYAFLHGGWTHLILNSVMMAALGTGVERWLGGRLMLALFLFCGIAGALCQFALAPQSTVPVVGASAGISGLFAGALLMMQRLGQTRRGARGLLPFILIWIAISAVFGVTGAPDGSSVAWAAHIGGFLAGFLFLRPVLRRRGL